VVEKREYNLMCNKRT